MSTKRSKSLILGTLCILFLSSTYPTLNTSTAFAVSTKKAVKKKVITEDKAMELALAKLKKAKGSSAVKKLSIMSNGKEKLDNKTYYYFSCGENKPEQFVTLYHIYVDVNVGTVLEYDVISDSYKILK